MANHAHSLADNVAGFGVNFKDAGNRTRDHYKSSMSRTRFRFRQALLPLIRWETPRLAWIQQHARSRILDDYFALTANLGAHTFFVIMLPMPFWFGFTQLGRELVYVLAYGVLFSGMLKDYMCLPRPLSPPLHRLNMSGSAALEYGFPSTHSTNAVAAALVILHYASPVSHKVVVVLTWLYMATILLGRIYCGMHGFLDVAAGTSLGVALFYIRTALSEPIDNFVRSPGPLVPLVLIPVIMILVRIHPEPVDPCPCFEDGVAFAGVVLGVDLGLHLSWNLPFFELYPYAGAAPFSFAQTGLLKSILRMVIGVALIFLWRAFMKKTLHTLLPPVYRVIEKIGLSMPRGFFLKASEYNKVPSSIPDSTLVGAGEIKHMLRNMRMRSDSVGPQSTADMYETIAYRTRAASEAAGEETLGSGTEMATQTANDTTDVNNNFDKTETDSQIEDQIYSEIPRPRVQYDVEVVTKLVVYSGIGYIGSAGCPILFHYLGI